MDSLVPNRYKIVKVNNWKPTKRHDVRGQWKREREEDKRNLP
jgi:hypothetical protein